MEYKVFESFEELAEHNSEDSCYVAYDGMLFDLTGNLEKIGGVTVDDCGTDLTPKLTADQGEIFYHSNVDNYIGSFFVESEEDVLNDEIVLETEQFEETPTTISDVDSSDLSLGQIGVLTFFLIAIIVVVTLLMLSLRKSDEECKKEEKEKKE